MKIIFNTKTEVVNFIVKFYQMAIANNIMRFIDDFGDDCDAAVNHERSIQDAEEEGNEELLSELLDCKKITVRRCCHICPNLPTMELNDKDISYELWEIILDTPLAYVCYGSVVRYLPTYKDIERDGIFWGDYVEENLDLVGNFQAYLEEKMDSMIG